MEARRILGDRYRLEDEIGRGGMAVVWRARDEVLGRAVAVKLLAGRYATDPMSRRRIHDEARAAAALSHPNIAQVYDYGEFDVHGVRHPYVVMELVTGRTLEQRLRSGQLTPRAAFRVCAEVAAALAAAHADGLVHRDVKPANVMVTAAGAKVVDFGIAAAINAGGDDDLDGTLLGTPAYLAPERLTGTTVEPASDVYALGVLLYKLLAGRLPWSVDTTTQQLTAHVYTPPAPLPQLPDVTEAVTDLCHRCLEKDPARRPSAREAASLLAEAAGLRVVDDDLGRALAPAADGGPSTVLVRKAAAVAPRGAGAGRRRAVAGVAGGVAVLLAVGAFAVWRPDRAHMAAGSPASAASSAAASTPAGGPSQDPTGNPSRGATEVGTRPAGPPPAGAAPTTRPPATPSAAAPPPAAPTTTAAGQTRVLDASPGGSVVATCLSGDRAHLLSTTPTKPYKLGTVDAGPAATATAAFVHGKKTVQLVVTCAGGVPTATVTDEG